jgi:hypothetical protein
MDFSADELQQEMSRLDATMACAIRLAGRGPDPVLDRRLAAHLRVLRAMLDDDGAMATEDAVEAARRAMDAAEPAAPLRMLDMAREVLAIKVRRQATRATGLRAA